MDIFAYGEDVLTFWALKNGLSEILGALGDLPNPVEHKLFFGPRFGQISASVTQTVTKWNLDSCLLAANNASLCHSAK